MRCKAAFLTTAASAVPGIPNCAFAATQQGSQAFVCHRRRNFRSGPGNGRRGYCGGRGLMQRGGGRGWRNGSRGVGGRGYGQYASFADDASQGNVEEDTGNYGQGWRNGGRGAGGRGYGQGASVNEDVSQGNVEGDSGNYGQGWRNGGCQYGWRNGGGYGGGRWNDQRIGLQETQGANDQEVLPGGGRCPGNMNNGGTPGGLTANEHGDIQFLFDNREGIQREVNTLHDNDNDNDNNIVGVETTTTSDNPDVVETLQRHVKDMKIHLDEGIPVRQRDPFFRAVFANHHKMVFEPTYTDNGVSVVHKGTTPCSSALAHGHSKVVTGFIVNGRSEAQKNHDIPEICQKSQQEEESS